MEERRLGIRGDGGHLHTHWCELVWAQTVQQHMVGNMQGNIALGVTPHPVLLLRCFYVWSTLLGTKLRVAAALPGGEGGGTLPERIKNVSNRIQK
jgi:hypothetical protein